MATIRQQRYVLSNNWCQFGHHRWLRVAWSYSTCSTCVWDERRKTFHLRYECRDVTRVETFAGDGFLLCGCGEAARHTVEAVARAEVELYASRIQI